MVAPANTPPAVVNRIHADVVKAMALPEIRDRMLTQAAEPVGSTPEQFTDSEARERTLRFIAGGE